MTKKYSDRGRVHHKIASVFRANAGPTTMADLEKVFAGTDVEPVLYRISTLIWLIRRDGGIVKVVKDGRKVVSYELVNVSEFNDKGFYVGKPAKAKSKQAPAPVVAKPEVEVEQVEPQVEAIEA